MSVVAMESHCIKTVMIHLVDKSGFLLSDHKTRCKSLGPFRRPVFKDPIFGSKNWKQAFRRSNFKVPFLW